MACRCRSGSTSTRRASESVRARLAPGRSRVLMFPQRDFTATGESDRRSDSRRRTTAVLTRRAAATRSARFSDYASHPGRATLRSIAPTRRPAAAPTRTPRPAGAPAWYRRRFVTYASDGPLAFEHSRSSSRRRDARGLLLPAFGARQRGARDRDAAAKRSVSRCSPDELHGRMEWPF